MTDTPLDQQFLEFIIFALVDNKDAVIIERTVDDYGIFFKVKVAKEDMGKIIGKKGKTAEAIKVLLRIIGSKQNTSISLKILDPEKDGEIE